MPARGPLSCDALEKRHANAKTDLGRNRSLSSAVRKGCAWAAAKEPPNPCGPKPRAFVTKRDREVGFVVSGGDCAPGVRVLVSELHKALVGDAKAACIGTRPSVEYKRCVTDAFFRGLAPRPVAPPQDAPIGPRVPFFMPPVPIIERPPVPFDDELPPPAPSIPDEPEPPPPAPMPPAPSPLDPPLSDADRDRYRAAVVDWLGSDQPWRTNVAGIDMPELEAYLRQQYARLPDCDRMVMRKKPTLGVSFTQRFPGKRAEAADLLLSSYPAPLPNLGWVGQGKRGK
jgi:hypothetical protein